MSLIERNINSSHHINGAVRGNTEAVWKKPTWLAVSLLSMTLVLGGCRDEPETKQWSAEVEPHLAPEVAGARWTPYFADLAAAAPANQVIEGSDGWLYFAPEIRHLGLDQFWGDAAAEVSRAEDPANADPLAAIVDFKEQLAAAGVRLIFVPVPAKAAVYPSPLPGDAPGTPSVLERADAMDAAFLKALTEAGVETIDLVPSFLIGRDRGPRLFCQQDTHWAPRGAQVAADRIAQVIGDTEWRAAQPRASYDVNVRAIVVEGDLYRRLNDPDRANEAVEAMFVTRTDEGGPQPVELDRNSPVLLLADSHGLVFHAGGDMHAEGAGLPEHLTRALGFPIDVIAVRGSGATPARVDLMRRGDNLAGKKVVVWVISVREYTEGQGWAKVPVIAPENT